MSDPEWHTDYTTEAKKQPRCLLIDYICRGKHDSNRRVDGAENSIEVDGIYTGKVVSTELSPEGLEQFYHEVSPVVQAIASIK